MCGKEPHTPHPRTKQTKTQVSPSPRPIAPPVNPAPIVPPGQSEGGVLPLSYHGARQVTYQMCAGWSSLWKRVAKDTSVTTASVAHRPPASKSLELQAGRFRFRAATWGTASRPMALAACVAQRPLRGRSSEPVRPPPIAGGILPFLRITLRTGGALGLVRSPGKESKEGVSKCPGICSSLRFPRSAGPRALGGAGSVVAARAARKRPEA